MISSRDASIFPILLFSTLKWPSVTAFSYSSCWSFALAWKLPEEVYPSTRLSSPSNIPLSFSLRVLWSELRWNVQTIKILTSMKLGWKFDFCFDFCLFASKSHLCEHHTELVFPSICRVIFILHVWVHITIEKLLVVFVCQHQTHALISCLTPSSQIIVSLDDGVKHILVEDNDFHLECLQYRVHD